MHIRFNAVVTGFFLFVELAAIVIACILGFFFAKSGLNWSELVNPHVVTPSGEAIPASLAIIAAGIGSWGMIRLGSDLPRSRWSGDPAAR